MSPPWILAARYVLVAVCLALTFASLAIFLAEERGRGELVMLLEEAGLNDAAERVRYERTLHHGRIMAARALLHTAELDAATESLPTVTDLARRILVAQPDSWEGAMLLGGAIYLERSLGRQRELYTAYRDWEEPLEKAMRGAPGKAEPRRFLVGAYLEVWPALSAEKKTAAKALLAKALATDPMAFSKLLPTWLDLAESREETFAVIPDTSAAWKEFERRFAEKQDWTTYCQAHSNRLEALLAENKQKLREAEQRLGLGELFHSRSLLLQVIAGSPRDLRFAPVVSRALEIYPPGLHGLASTEPLRDWLRWSLKLHFHGKNPLPDQVISRLAAAAGQLEPHEQALAALVSGEVHHAEQFEQLTESLTHENWGGYLLAKARHHLSQDRPDEAASVLERADRATRRRLIYALIRQEIARGRDDLVELATANRIVDGLRSREWSATQWQWQGYQASLTLLPQAPAAGIRLALNNVPPAGAVVEVHWDGKAVAFEPIREDGELELKFPVSDDLHLLELRTVAGSQLYPGRVYLFN